MIKQTIYILAACCLAACTQVNSNGSKTITQGEDTISEVDISVSKIDALNTLAEMDEEESVQLVFKATGIEPGWFAEFYNQKLRVLLDYGKDSVVLDKQHFDVAELKKDDVFNVSDGKSPANNILIKLENKSCVDAGSGDTKDRQVTLSYKGKTYKGCGSFVK